MKLQSPHFWRLHQSTMQDFILGSEQMRDIMGLIREVAQYDVNVMLIGESGTGKELLAKTIHLLSPRTDNAFVPVNCGVLSGLMFEDKLFGHEKGSFTGAIRRERGCFELAHQGTLFLDEVLDIPGENQVDFLRVLEDFRFLRLGGTELLEVDVRIVSATNRDPRELVGQGLFREDLFYRLHVVPIHVPPLRERGADIPLMADRFLDDFSAAYGKPRPVLSPRVIDIFQNYNWPGNVRELKNLMERVFIVNKESRIGPEQLPSDFQWAVGQSRDKDLDLAAVRQRAETGAILDVLSRVEGDRDRAARILGVSPRTLRYKLREYGLKVDRRGRPVT